MVVDPAARPPFDVWRERRPERGVTTPPVVFECVGAPGLVQQLVETCEMWTRIHVAGAWYTGDTINCTDAARKGITLHFGGGPLPDDWYGTLDAVCEGRLDPLPSVGRVIGLDDVPAALDQARRAQGPAAHHRPPGRLSRATTSQPGAGRTRASGWDGRCAG